ncbi:hypothetical protein H0H92_008010, partial [Tricholoma furcatifolium]
MSKDIMCRPEKVDFLFALSLNLREKLCFHFFYTLEISSSCVYVIFELFESQRHVLFPTDFLIVSGLHPGIAHLHLQLVFWKDHLLQMSFRIPTWH